jgi:hypothetical protein
MEVNEKECEAGGKDVKAIASLARRFAALSKEMQKQGVYLFGGSGTGQIRCKDSNEIHSRPLVLAEVGQGFDGGCGACDNYGPDGLMRGE